MYTLLINLNSFFIILSLTGCMSKKVSKNKEQVKKTHKIDDNKDDILLPHPRKATAYDTKVLIMKSEKPVSENILNCKIELDELVPNIQSEDKMIEARNILYSKVLKNSKLFHWCFYHLIVSLDDKLNIIDKTNKEKIIFFNSQMQRLWLLSRALDLAVGTNSYFKYLQKRYIDISQSHFGRDLQVGPSLDETIIYFQNEKDM